MDVRDGYTIRRFLAGARRNRSGARIEWCLPVTWRGSETPQRAAREGRQRARHPRAYIRHLASYWFSGNDRPSHPATNGLRSRYDAKSMEVLIAAWSSPCATCLSYLTNAA